MVVSKLEAVQEATSSHQSLDTPEEKHQFFKDVKFLVDSISANQTYHTVAPLMNFWAAYTPSKQVSSNPYAVSSYC